MSLEYDIKFSAQLHPQDIERAVKNVYGEYARDDKDDYTGWDRNPAYFTLHSLPCRCDERDYCHDWLSYEIGELRRLMDCVVHVFSKGHHGNPPGKSQGASEKEYCQPIGT